MRRELPDLVAAATSFAHSRITSNPTRLHSAMLRIQAQGQTVLYDALFAGLDHLADSSLSRKVLIVVSDGGDNANQHKLPVLLEAMKRSDAAVYSVGLFDEYDRDRNPRVLKQLARLSGGVAYFPKEGSDAATVLQAISQDIRNQYTIGYVSTGERRDKAYHAIRVTVVAPQSARWTDRTRPGYFAKPVNNPQ
jgi:Ca-activated chloride channel family protein